MIGALLPHSTGNGPWELIEAPESWENRAETNGLLLAKQAMEGFCPACAVSTHIPFPMQGWMTAARRADFQ
jgi:hypothetical protein